MPVIFLTDEDHSILQELIRDRKGGRINAPNRQTPRLSDEGASHQAPEVYIAIVPTGGLDGRTGTTPGSAQCNIHRIVAGALEEVPSFTETIYNISESAIGEDQYISVKRDKYGTWLADTGGGGGSIILFKVTDTDEAGSGCVTATVELIPCGGADVAVGDEITVQDEAGCNFNINPELLLGGYGFATKMQTTAICDPYDTAECQWVVITMCCQTGCP